MRNQKVAQAIPRPASRLDRAVAGYAGEAVPASAANVKTVGGPPTILNGIKQQLDGVLARIQTLGDRVKGHADYALGQQPDPELTTGSDMPVAAGRVYEIDQLTGIAHNLLTDLEYQVGRLEAL